MNSSTTLQEAHCTRLLLKGWLPAPALFVASSSLHKICLSIRKIPLGSLSHPGSWKDPCPVGGRKPSSFSCFSGGARVILAVELVACQEEQGKLGREFLRKTSVFGLKCVAQDPGMKLGCESGPENKIFVDAWAAFAEEREELWTLTSYAWKWGGTEMQHTMFFQTSLMFLHEPGGSVDSRVSIHMGLGACSGDFQMKL